jgi:hypothetical protein
MSGVKHSQGKPPLGIIPYEAEEAEGLAFLDGKNKYGLWNYLGGGEQVGAIEISSAVKRHIGAWLRGEECAPDSGVHHLGHARAGLAMLIKLQAEGILHDDRYKKPTKKGLRRKKKSPRRKRPSKS